MSLKIQSFHRVLGPALGVPLMEMHPSNPSSSVFGDVGGIMRSIFDPLDLLGAARGLSHDLIRAPVDIAHEASSAVTSVAGSLGTTVTGVAGSLENTASSLLSSPLVLVGGAALLVILLSNR